MLLLHLDAHWRETAVRQGFDELLTIAFPNVNPLTARADSRDASAEALPRRSARRQKRLPVRLARNERPVAQIKVELAAA